MISTLKHVIADDRGQGLTEYALILAIVAVAAVTVLRTLSEAINGELTKAASDI